MNIKLKGLLCGAVAAATYGMNPLFTLPLYQQGMDADSVLFCRYLLAAGMLAALMVRQRESFQLANREVLPVVIGGVLFSISSLSLFVCYNYMAAGIASTLLFVYPVMVALIMAVFFKEKITRVTQLSIALSLVGIGLLYKGEDGAVLSFTGVVLVLISALSYAIYIVGINFSALKSMPTLKLTFYVLVSGLVIYFVRLRCGLDLKLACSWSGVLNLLALALLPTVISLLCTRWAVAAIGSTPTAILGALEPVTAIFFGVLIFHEVLTFRLICGVVLIIVAVSLIVAGPELTRRVEGWLARRRRA